MHTFVATYVCTCMSTQDVRTYVHTFIHISTNAALMLAASVLGTTIKFYKKKAFRPPCLKIPGENTAYVRTYVHTVKLVYKDRSRHQVIVVAIDRWSLSRGAVVLI